MVFVVHVVFRGVFVGVWTVTFGGAVYFREDVDHRNVEEGARGDEEDHAYGFVGA